MTPLNKNSMREQPKIGQVKLTANNSPTKQFAIQHSSFDQAAKKIGERVDCDDVEQVGETKADTKEYFSIDFISHSMTDASSSNYDSTTPPTRIDYEDGKETSAREEIKLLDKEAEMKGEAKSSTDISESHESNSSNEEPQQPSYSLYKHGRYDEVVVDEEELNTFVDILSQENPELLDFNVNKQARLEALENLHPWTKVVAPNIFPSW
jgi:hypothetical protein